MTFYKNMLSYWDDKDGQERAKQRWKYFEVEGYRKLSNIENINTYSSRVEVIYASTLWTSLTCVMGIN